MFLGSFNDALSTAYIVVSTGRLEALMAYFKHLPAGNEKNTKILNQYDWLPCRSSKQMLRLNHDVLKILLSVLCFNHVRIAYISYTRFFNKETVKLRWKVSMRRDLSGHFDVQTHIKGM